MLVLRIEHLLLLSMTMAILVVILMILTLRFMEVLGRRRAGEIIQLLVLLIMIVGQIPLTWLTEPILGGEEQEIIMG